MPMYEYKCPACGINVDRITRIDDRDRQTCECGNFLSRQVTAPHPPVFKGVSGSCSMSAGMQLPDTSLTTSPM